MNREKKNAQKNGLKSLIVDGQEVNDKGKIKEEINSYFNALLNGHHNRDLVDTGRSFETDFLGLPEFLEDIGKLDEENQEKLVKTLTFEEVADVIKYHIEAGRSPGLDGLPYEFYKSTWSVIGQDFAQVLKENFQE